MLNSIRRYNVCKFHSKCTLGTIEAESADNKTADNKTAESADSKQCCINVRNLYLYRAYACIIYSYYTYHVIYDKIVHSVN